MKLLLSDLAVILNLLLMMHATAAHSLPAMGDNVIVSRREADSDLPGVSSDHKDDMVSQFQAELANLSMPSHLKDIFSSFNGIAGLSLNHEDTEINTIQSYENEAKNASCGYYKFDVRGDTIDGELIRAELHLLQKKSTTLGGHYNVDIYYLFNESSHQSPLQFTFKHIDSTPGWKTFDITPIVLSWKLGSVNHGLQLRLTKGEQILSCEGVFSQGEGDPMNTKPLLIVFANDHDSSFFKRMLKENRKSMKKSHVKIQPQEINRIARNTVNSGCHRAALTVTKTQLSTEDVQVVLPHSFDAGVCDGHCTKLKVSYDNPDYRHILSLYYRNTLSLSDTPSRCCVPISYNKISMLFFRNGQYTQKRVPALLKSCVCM